ncbi:MAG: hypothetical protein HC909_01395 [Blastochloris sp.]|nr:hypothetical protein [Blastochloris sp.]
MVQSMGMVVRGAAEAMVGGTMALVQENDRVALAARVGHRLANPDMMPLKTIEAQRARCLSEDDILRFDDVNQRPVFDNNASK